MISSDSVILLFLFAGLDGVTLFFLLMFFIVLIGGAGILFLQVRYELTV